MTDNFIRYDSWTFSGDMKVTDRGFELLFGRDALIEHLLWQLTEHWPHDSEMGDSMCCDGQYGGAGRWFGAPGDDRLYLVEHEESCPWMRAHRVLNRSTVHEYEVHAWKEPAAKPPPVPIPDDAEPDDQTGFVVWYPQQFIRITTMENPVNDQIPEVIGDLSPAFARSLAEHSPRVLCGPTGVLVKHSDSPTGWLLIEAGGDE